MRLELGVLSTHTKPMIITSITTEYIADEDRIRLAVSGASGNARVLWLTRRIAARMAAVLVEWLAKSGSGFESGADGSADTDALNAAQVYAQLAARLAQKPSPAVQPAADAVHAVIHEVKLARANNGSCQLSFCCKNQSDAILKLDITQLRQWLEVLRLAFKKADWRQDFWPDWIQGIRQ